MKQPTDVQPGQMFRDMDPRSVGAGELTVLEIWGEKAIVQRQGRKTRIRCDRLLNPRHYQFIGRSR